MKVTFNDTVINGDSLTYLSTYYNNKNDRECNTSNVTRLKQKGDTIWFKNTLTNNTWQILYNFNVAPGQNWMTTIYPASAPAKNYIVQVDSVLTKIVNGYPLKPLAVRYFGGKYGIEKTHITERLECNLYMFNYYVSECATDQPWFRQFLCYKDDEIRTYQASALPCNYTQVMSIGDLYGSSISLFPNPAHNKLFVEGLQNSNDRLSLSITDVGGRERIRRNLREEKEVIEISYLPGGFYFVSIYNGDTVVKNLKLVVDR